MLIKPCPKCAKEMDLWAMGASFIRGKCPHVYEWRCKCGHWQVYETGDPDVRAVWTRQKEKIDG
jgi:hypothetical protein